MRLGYGARGFLLGCALWLSAVSVALATPYRGQVTFNGMPLPGSQVTVTATQGDKKVVAVTDDQGLFNFPDLADGNWTLTIEMTGFAPVKEQVSVGPSTPIATFEMKLMTLDQIRAADKPAKADTTLLAAVTPAAPAAANAAPGAAAGAPASAAPAAAANAKAKGGKTQAAAGGPGGLSAPEPAQDSQSAQANDGFLINGSVNNAATSQFSLNQAFGNNRNGGRWRYNGGASLQIANSALNARPFSLDGQQTEKLPFTNLVAAANVGGPLEIPHLLPYSRAPYFFAGYSRTENKTEQLLTGLMPTAAMIGGNLSQTATGAPNTATIYAPTSGLSSACLSAPGVVPGQPFPGNVIPSACLSSQAQYLLTHFYPAPQPGLAGTQYNYQLGLAQDTHTDSYRGQLQKGFGNKNNLNGNFTIQSTRSSTPSIFGFLDTSSSLSEAVNASWYHRFTQRLSLQSSYNFSRARSYGYSYFQNRTDVEGNAGITGYDTDPTYYGPPSLGFTTSQVQGLNDGVASRSTPETNSYSAQLQWNRFRHNMSFGVDFRRQEWNYLTQSNPRGMLTFTGQQTENSAGTGGYDFADFLLGLPDTSSIAYGNADKYLRQSAWDAYVDDDFRVSPELSIRAGVRWEYGSPITETKNRLVNLDVTPGFTQAVPVVATNPTGSVSGQHYPTSLIRPDYSFPEPKIGIAWRPISGSSLLVRAGYGIYNDTSVYTSTARAMDQQAPLSTSLSVPNTAACRFTIAAPFQQLPCATTTADSFAVDPNFKVGYAQVWNLQVQRDLPFALQLTAIYTGIKGTRGVQEIMPNTYPLGLTTSPYGSAPVGYYWRDSEGDSTKESGSVQLRRRLKNGFTASVLYTYSKALDDDYSLGGQGPTPSASGSSAVAQDWTNPKGQRGLSTFDQRNVLNATIQYTTGMGLGGHTMLSGWRATAYKDWTVVLTVSEASGLPSTPIYGATLNGATCTQCIRPDVTGQSLRASTTPGTFLNAAAFTAPAAGTWGNARRDSIIGPNQFGLNAQMQRSFRIHDRYNLAAQITANNVLNHEYISSWNTNWSPLTTTLFGAPGGTNGSRTVTIGLRGTF